MACQVWLKRDDSGRQLWIAEDLNRKYIGRGRSRVAALRDLHSEFDERNRSA